MAPSGPMLPDDGRAPCRPGLAAAVRAFTDQGYADVYAPTDQDYAVPIQDAIQMRSARGGERIREGEGGVGVSSKREPIISKQTETRDT